MAIDQKPVKLDTPGSAGNGVPTLLATANIRKVVASLINDVDGEWWGSIPVPENYASGPKIKLRLLANAVTGSTRVTVSTAVKDAGDVFDAALTAEAAQDLAVPATAYQAFDGTFTLSTTPVAGKTLIVRIQHNGTHANDTLAVPTLIWQCVFEYTTT